MNNQRTPLDRANTVHYSRQTGFGYQDDNNNNDDTQRANQGCARDASPKRIHDRITMASTKQPPRLLPPPEPPPPEPRRPISGTSAENYARQRAITMNTRADPRAPSPDMTIDNHESRTPPSPPEPPPPEPRRSTPDTPAANCARQHARSTCADTCAPSPETTIPSRESPTPPPPSKPLPPKPRRYKSGTSTIYSDGREAGRYKRPHKPIRTTTHQTTIHDWERPLPPSKPPTPEACRPRPRQGTVATAGLPAS